MRVPEPLRNSPFQMFRRRSLYTGLYGSEPSGPIQPPRNVTGAHGVPFQSSPGLTPKTYMSDFPDEYAPHPGPMRTPSSSYQPYDGTGIPNVSRSDQPLTMDEFQIAALRLGEGHTGEPEVEYEDGLMDEDYFDIQMKLLNKQFDGPPVIPFDSNQIAAAILRGQQRDEAFEFDRDLRANMIEIQMAVEQARLDANAEPADFGLTIPHDFFERQKQMFESQFRESDPAQFDYGAEMEAMFQAQEALFDPSQPDVAAMEQIISGEPVEPMGPLAFPGGESLEQIIEAHEMLDEGMMPDEMPDYDDSLMTPQLFEQGMEPMEPRPDPFEPYGGMMPQEMYDEQMPGMMDPYMTPEMMHPYMMPGMMDPYMMPGLFGPEPILDPGPGGPP